MAENERAPTLRELLAARGVHPGPEGDYQDYIERMEPQLRRLPRAPGGIVATCMHLTLGRTVSVRRFRP